MSGKAIVVDANILIRAVLGKQVRELLFDHAATPGSTLREIALAPCRDDDTLRAAATEARKLGILVDDDADQCA